MQEAQIDKDMYIWNDSLKDALHFGLLLFQDGKTNGLDEHQFYAMLRLIAHAQNGRTISRDMVYLGGKDYIHHAI